MTHRPGFTLIELLVVLVIIGVWAGIAIPRVANSLSHYRVDAAARRIARDLALAQRQAKASRTSQKVTFDVAANSYELVGRRSLDSSTEPYVVPLSDPPYQATIVSADFGGDGDTEIVFDGYGVPDSGGSILVQVGSHQRNVSVDPDTGQVQVP